MLLTSSYETLVKPIRIKKKRIAPEKCKKQLFKHLEYENKLLCLLGEDNIEFSDLTDIIDKLKKIRKESSELFGLPYEDIQNIGKLIAVKDRELNHNLLDKYNCIVDEIKNINIKLEESEIPEINLNLLIDFINIFNHTLLNKADKLKSINTEQNLIYINKKDEKIPIMLKSGKKLILTNRNIDLSPFSRGELIEILRVLDIIIKDDDFNYLRTKITQRLSNYSTISFAK